MARIALIFIIFATSISACNTVEGIGEDISAGARSVRDL